MVRFSLIAFLVLSAGVGFAQGGRGADDPEGILAAQMPGGQFVDVGVNDDLDYQLTIFDTHGKVVRKLDASALWEGGFVPALVCGISKSGVLVLGNPVTNAMLWSST